MKISVFSAVMVSVPVLLATLASCADVEFGSSDEGSVDQSSDAVPADDGGGLPVPIDPVNDGVVIVDEQDGGSDIVEPAVSCEGSTPPVGSCAASEENGIFVAPGGSDGACGTRELPCGTLAAGIDRAASRHKRVYVCGDLEHYTENVVVGGYSDGLELFGGFHCGSWEYDPDNVRAEVAPTSGSALTVRELKKGVAFYDFAFASPDETIPGSSSISVKLFNSAGVLFSNVSIKAGAGANGQHGSHGVNAESSNDAEYGYQLVGQSGSCDASTSLVAGGSRPIAFSCLAGGSSRGGSGGASVVSGTGLSGMIGTPTSNVLGSDTGEGGIGGTLFSPVGGDGCDGSDGVSGDHGHKSYGGSLNIEGYSPGRGNNGADGSPGQGGGGGGAGWSATVVGGICRGGGGGSGGNGGCGGFRGTGGGGGGASIAVFSVSSSITLENCEITAGTGGIGGNGGNGGKGGPGMAGSDGGGRTISVTEKAHPSGNGGRGGRGGRGGDGGGGSGGGGGPSFAFALANSDLNRIGSVIVSLGFGGSGGIGGTRSDGTAAPQGHNGRTEAIELFLVD